MRQPTTSHYTTATCAFKHFHNKSHPDLPAPAPQTVSLEMAMTHAGQESYAAHTRQAFAAWKGPHGGLLRPARSPETTTPCLGRGSEATVQPRLHRSAGAQRGAKARTAREACPGVVYPNDVPMFSGRYPAPEASPTRAGTLRRHGLRVPPYALQPGISTHLTLDARHLEQNVPFLSCPPSRLLYDGFIADRSLMPCTGTTVIRGDRIVHRQALMPASLFAQEGIA